MAKKIKEQLSVIMAEIIIYLDRHNPNPKPHFPWPEMDAILKRRKRKSIDIKA